MEESPLSQDELDAMFGDPEPVESLVDDDTGVSTEVEDPDELPEPDPIPNVFTVPDAEPEPKPAGLGRRILIACLVVVGLIAVSAGGLVLARVQVAMLWPPAKSIFAMVGLSTDVLGAGLEIRNVQSERAVEAGVEMIVVRGVIANISDQPRPVPMIRVLVYNGEREVLRELAVEPLRKELPAGDTIGFKARVKEPSVFARGLEVLFAEAEMAPEG